MSLSILDQCQNVVDFIAGKSLLVKLAWAAIDSDLKESERKNDCCYVKHAMVVTRTVDTTISDRDLGETLK